MLLAPFSILVALATGWLALLLSGRLPGTIGSLMSIALWVAIVPSAFAVEIGAESGSVETVQQPTLAFLAVAGVGVSALYLFADVTGRISRDSSPQPTR